MAHLYYGTPTPQDEQLASELAKWSPAIKIVKSKDVCLETANLLADGAVIGWVQGRSEFGPRALGNRSILADPRPAENKSRINKMIKKREGYRPFAPAVLIERANEFFNINASSRSWQFMNLITSVREEKRQILGAITHVDGSARIQVVRKETNDKFWSLINEFNKITGIPILLNTSFNNNVEPIVDSVTDAIVCFLTTELTHLIVEDYIIYKEEPIRNCLKNFYISIRESYKLTAGFKPASGSFGKVYSIEFNRSRYFSRVNTEVSERLFRIAIFPSSEKVWEIARKLSIELDEALETEMLALWSDRVLNLGPVNLMK